MASSSNSLIFRVKRRKSRGKDNKNQSDFKFNDADHTIRDGLRFTFTRKRKRKEDIPTKLESINSTKSLVSDSVCESTLSDDSLQLLRIFNRLYKAEILHFRKNYSSSESRELIDEINKQIKNKFLEFLQSHEPTTIPDVVPNSDNAILRAREIELKCQIESLRQEEEQWLNILKEAQEMKPLFEEEIPLRKLSEEIKETEDIEKAVDMSKAAIESFKANASCLQSAVQSFKRLVDVAERKHSRVLEAFHKQQFAAFGDVTNTKDLIRNITY